MSSDREQVHRDESLRGVDLHLGCHGATVVHGATIALRPSSVTALAGPNGSGKSTLLRALARLHRKGCSPASHRPPGCRSPT